MTKEDIIRMARTSHLDVYGLGKDREKYFATLERFAALVAAAEREACAKVCEDMGIEGYGTLAIAAAIRARGQA